MDCSVNSLKILVTTVIILTQVITVGSFILEADDPTPCGNSEVQPLAKRIIGGEEATIGSWPWIVLLAEVGYHICGGSILNERVILTAAHCFDGELSHIPDRWTVFAGKHYTNRVDDAQTSYHVDRILVHADYDNQTLKHDIALLVLRESISYSDFARPICIPPTYRRVVPHDTVCYAAGWGDTRGTSNPYTINQVALPLLNDYWCSRPDWYGTSFIPRLTFCAGYGAGRKDACLGDSGGPYMCKVNGTWFQQGVVSWGWDCGQPRWPGIYTDVSKYRRWIIDNMSKEGYPMNV